MDPEEIKSTDTWQLYEKGRNYARLENRFTNTDKFHRFYNGDQWNGLKVKGIEPVQENFIETIVNFKVSNINANLWAVNLSSENFEKKEFRAIAEETCKMLNRKIAKCWEKDNFEKKSRQFSNDSAITGEAVAYIYYDKDTQTPITERLTRNDIFFANENNDNIQEQPYILIKRRMPVANVIEYAKSINISNEKLGFIVGDTDTFENAGDDAKIEQDNMCTIITKMYKRNGKVYFTESTRYLELKKDKATGFNLYPVAHWNWKEKVGSARGQGEVEFLIPSQIEYNKTLMRRLVTVKHVAYPTKAVNIDLIDNPEDLEKTGALIKVNGKTGTSDVSNAFANIQPAMMSQDVNILQNDLMNVTRELAGANEFATGGVDPTKASGKAILAVQQAQQQPLTNYLIGLKSFLEDIARIDLDMFITHSQEGLKLERIVTDEDGTERIEIVNVPQTVLSQLKASVKIDITPKSAFDRYAQELSIIELAKEGFFNIQKLPELKILSQVLEDDSTLPKMTLEKIVKLMEDEQQKIAQINNQAAMMKQQADQFLNMESDAQADYINNLNKDN